MSLVQADLASWPTIATQTRCRKQAELQNGGLGTDHIVVEMARKISGEGWLEECVALANAGGLSGCWG